MQIHIFIVIFYIHQLHLHFHMVISRGVDPYGTGGHVPHNIYEGGRPW